MDDQKLLIVEDEILIGLSLKMDLEQAGYLVIGPASSGPDAINTARNENPSIILMDIRLMGEMDGIEAAGQIRDFSSAKIIFNTGYQDNAIRERAMKLNPAGFLSKPIKPNQVDAIIRSENVTEAESHN
jgi:YesN/AraC family two-component response regulator